MNKILAKLSFILSLMLFFWLLQCRYNSMATLMNGAQEAPSNASPATGVGMGTLDTVSGLLAWDINWTGLTADAMQFHGSAVSG